MPWKGNPSGNYSYSSSGAGLCPSCGKSYRDWPQLQCNRKQLHDPYALEYPPNETNPSDLMIYKIMDLLRDIGFTPWVMDKMKYEFVIGIKEDFGIYQNRGESIVRLFGDWKPNQIETSSLRYLPDSQKENFFAEVKVSLAQKRIENPTITQHDEGFLLHFYAQTFPIGSSEITSDRITKEYNNLILAFDTFKRLLSGHLNDEWRAKLSPYIWTSEQIEQNSVKLEDFDKHEESEHTVQGKNTSVRHVSWLSPTESAPSSPEPDLVSATDEKAIDNRKSLLKNRIASLKKSLESEKRVGVTKYHEGEIQKQITILEKQLSDLENPETNQMTPGKESPPADYESDQLPMHRCSYCGKLREQTWNCSKCGQTFCVKHIALADHHCESLPRIAPQNDTLVGARISENTPVLATESSIPKYSRFRSFKRKIRSLGRGRYRDRYRSSRRIRIRKIHAFLIMWIALFLAGFAVARMSVILLTVVSLVDTIILFIPLFIIWWLFHRRIAGKIFAIFLILIFAIYVYQTPTSFTRVSLTNELYNTEASFLSSLYSSVSSTPSQSGSNGNVGPVIGNGNGGTPSSTSATSTGRPTSYSLAFAPANPTFSGGSADISYPPIYAALVNLSLTVINKDRADFGLSPVSLSTIPSGQQHADSMMFFGYFSHWDTQGYKPYMRYTMLGGRGSVAENVAMEYCMSSSQIYSYASEITPTNCTIKTIENALNDSEWQMMYNDASCCQNGHRDNILDPLHDRVSIGIAYNVTSDAVFLVEDFENDYLNFTTLTIETSTITMSGNVINSADLTPWPPNTGYSGATISVYFDPVPQSISVGVGATQLESLSCFSGPVSCVSPVPCITPPPGQSSTCENYWGSYDPGTFVGEVFGPCPAGYICSGELQGGGTAYYANTWQTSGSTFNIQFGISSIIQQNGNGVYTFYLYPNNSNDTITSLSFFEG